MVTGHQVTRSGIHPFAKVAAKLAHRNTLLLHTIAIAPGHGLVFKRLEIDRDTEWRPNLILPPVELPNRPRVVIDCSHMPFDLERAPDVFCQPNQPIVVALKRKDGGLDWCKV